MMPPQIDLCLVTRESAVVSAVCSALCVNGEWSQHSVFASLNDLAPRLQRQPRAAIVVDIDPKPDHALSELDSMTRRFAEARFIVVSSSFNGELVLQAMQAGARHFMLKTSIPVELINVTRRLGFDQPPIVLRNGYSIVLLSAAGGCGTTTLAVNLATELHHISREPVLMVDLDEHYGGLGAYLGVQGQYGIADVLAHPGHIDPQLIASTAVTCGQGLHLLLSPACTRASGANELRLNRLDSVVESANLAYGYNVFDAPRLPIHTSVGLARKSQLTIIVFQMTVKDLRYTRILKDSLHAGNVSEQNIMLLANRFRSRHALLSLHEVHKCLGTAAVTCVDNDYRSASQGNDYGKPLAEVAPKSSIRKSMIKLAKSIVDSRAHTISSIDTAGH